MTTPSSPAPIESTSWPLALATVAAFFVVVGGFGLMLSGAGRAARR